MSIGWPEVLLIVVIVLLLFGASRVPQLARSLGRAVNEFKKGKDEGANDKDAAPKDPEDRHDA